VFSRSPEEVVVQIGKVIRTFLVEPAVSPVPKKRDLQPVPVQHAQRDRVTPRLRD
jgi:hypothetical protein